MASLTKSIALEMLLSDKPELSEKRVERMPNSRAFSFIFWINCKRLIPAERESAMDLVKLAKYSLNKAQIKNLSNMPSAFIQAGGRSVFVKNTNKLVREEVFDAAINKTGYIRESGYNLVFVNKNPCNHSTIGVISLNNHSSAFRSNFTKGKLEQYGCTAGRSMQNFTVDEDQYEEGYDESGMDRLIQRVGG